MFERFQVLTILCLCYFCFLPQVELLIPQLQFLDDEGAQAELWELSGIFLNTLIEETGCQVTHTFQIIVSEFRT